MVELHVHTLFSLQLMVFSYFPAACPAHSWQDQKSLSSKVNWAGFEADRGFGRIRALTNRTNAKAAGSLSIADQSMFQDMELSRTCVSLRRNAQQIVSEWALLYYLCWFTCLWTTYFLKEPFCLLFYFIFEVLCPCSPAGCPLSGSVIYDRFLCLYLLSQSFQGSLLLVLSSKGAYSDSWEFISLQLVAYVWKRLSGKDWPSALGKLYFPQADKWIIPVTRYSKYPCLIHLVIGIAWNPVLVQSVFSSESHARDIYNYWEKIIGYFKYRKYGKSLQ